MGLERVGTDWVAFGKDCEARGAYRCCKGTCACKEKRAQTGKVSPIFQFIICVQLGYRVVISVDRVFKKSTVQPTSVHLINISML